MVILGVLFFFVPILQVGCVRVIDPPFTAPMLSHIADRHYAWLDLPAMPRDVLRFVLYSEDQRFLEHRGFDWREISRARRDAIRAGKEPRGASTITQQCARSLFLWQGRSWIRKGLEAYYTVWMELLLPKRRIFELYANIVELGDGIYGVQAAAQQHYGIPARELGRRQCATLAALLAAPGQWDPRHPSPRFSTRIERILHHEHEALLPESLVRTPVLHPPAETGR
jgi:monofunctional biosynthetic peptidoglycan transglycosylase